MSEETFSVVSTLLKGQPVQVTGVGELRLQPDQDGPPVGPGSVTFGLSYAPEDLPPGTAHARALALRLSGSDDEGRSILHSKVGEESVPMARYDLSGEAEVEERCLPIHLETIYVDPRTPASVRQFFGQDNARSLTCGKVDGAGLSGVRAIVPNLWVPRVDAQARGLRIWLEPQIADSVLTDPLHAGKVVPGCILTLEKMSEGSDLDLLEAVEVFGYLLSFYAGRAVLPSAWENVTMSGDLWGIKAHEVTPLPIDERRTCLPRNSDTIGSFLTRAWERWAGFNEQEKGRLRGVTNLYRFMLSATFPIEQIALTAIYLEGFRELVVGTSELLPTMETFSTGKGRKVESDLRNALREAIAENTRLDDKQKEILAGSLKQNPGNIRNLFRRSFRESLLELYEKARLEVDKDELAEFIRERDSVIHGSWDPSRAGTMKTHRWAEYGINLIERLVLRYFGYEGEYFNRITANIENFTHLDPSW